MNHLANWFFIKLVTYSAIFLLTWISQWVLSLAVSHHQQQKKKRYLWSCWIALGMYGWKCTAQLVCDADLWSNSAPFQQLNRPEQKNQAQVGAVQGFWVQYPPAQSQEGIIASWTPSRALSKCPSSPNHSIIPCFIQGLHSEFLSAFLPLVCAKGTWQCRVLICLLRKLLHTKLPLLSLPTFLLPTELTFFSERKNPAEFC